MVVYDGCFTKTTVDDKHGDQYIVCQSSRWACHEPIDKVNTKLILILKYI